VAPTAAAYVHAKVDGTVQLLMVVAQNYPRPIMADNKIPAASTTCVHCHSPGRFFGDKIVITNGYADDKSNTKTSSVTLMHVGGRDSFAHLSGIHGAHMGKIEYIAVDTTDQTIPWVGKANEDGSVTEFVASGTTSIVMGEKRLMDCIDCHNRAAHSFDTPEDALNKDMALGSPSASLPFVHQESLSLLKAIYKSQAEADARITSGLVTFYRSQYPAIWNRQSPQVYAAAKALISIYDANVFPSMKVTWGTHPNNIGHNNSPGCFRCHDGNHVAKGGASITNDCSACHNLVVSDATRPRVIADMGMQQ